MGVSPSETMRGPAVLWMVRHGQSTANVAWEAAEAQGHERIEQVERDMDVPLSPLGERQADALGAHFARLGAEERPTVLLVSPYVRARTTAERVARAGGLGVHGCVVRDERLREKEFGLLEQLTRKGAAARFPDWEQSRAHLGKFYFRPPGGESWCDVVFRLRSLLESLCREYAGERVLLVAHSVVVMCLRYLLEHLEEQELLALDASVHLANCALTEYRWVAAPGRRGRMERVRFNDASVLEQAGTQVTAPPDAAGEG